ncbi:unnamed protein product [Trichobilharzia szidati]|nr:unnamed protein product [Trichobilharzia szidati]
MLLVDFLYLFIGSIFLFGIISAESRIYVVRNQPFDGLVDSFQDAVSVFGPEIFHRDGYLVVAKPADACTDIQPPPSNFSGQDVNRSAPVVFNSYFALIRRGKCDFDLKAWNAQQKGYRGVIVYNTVDGKIFPMNGRKYVNLITIPSVMVDKSAGLKLMRYSVDNNSKEFMINMVSFYGLPLKYVLLALLIVVGISLLILVISFVIHLCRFWRRINRGRLSRRHLRRLVIKRFAKGLDPYDVCSICLEDYAERDKLRLLPCQHAFHMKCIDPWLLCNRRRCPICNQIVQLPGAPAMPDESDVEVVNDNDRLASIPRRLYNFIRRRNSYDRDNRRASVESQQSNGHYEAGEERTPLLFNTGSTVECHTCNDDTGMHNSYLESRHPKTTQSSFRQVDDEDDELVDVKSSPTSSSSGRSSSSPPAIESQSLCNNNDNNNCNETMNISSSTSSSHLLPNVIKSTSPQSLSPSVQPGDSNQGTGVLSSSPQNNSTLAPNVSTTTVTSSTPTTTATTTRDDSGEDDLLLTDVNVKTA